MNLFSRLKGNIKMTPALDFPKAGVYHFLRETQEEKSRIHLRIDEDGSGTLIVNANRIFHFNPTAASMAYLLLNRATEANAVRSLKKRFAISAEHARQDYAQFANQLEGLISPDACPICDLELEVTPPFTARPSAPYRMDLALTYRCNNNCAHCYNARPRNYPELSTQDWFNVLDQLWEIGIPHIVFTGGEPTLRSDLPDLIRHAEANGQITGLNTNGRALKDPAYVQQLTAAGLDHVQITFESHVPEIHDRMVRSKGAWNETLEGLKNALVSRLYVMTNTTMLQDNAVYIPDTLEFLGNLGLKTIGLNALIYSGRGKSVGTGLPEASLTPLLARAREITEKFNQRLIWYTPTQYCHFDPMDLSLGVKGCTAALYNMCIEPDGAVIPCQSYYESLGSFLEKDWKQIWNHDLAVSLRERKLAPDKCFDCSLFGDCGGGCPLAKE